MKITNVNQLLALGEKSKIAALHTLSGKRVEFQHDSNYTSPWIIVYYDHVLSYDDNEVGLLGSHELLSPLFTDVELVSCTDEQRAEVERLADVEQPPASISPAATGFYLRVNPDFEAEAEQWYFSNLEPGDRFKKLDYSGEFIKLDDEFAVWDDNELSGRYNAYCFADNSLYAFSAEDEVEFQDKTCAVQQLQLVTEDTPEGTIVVRGNSDGRAPQFGAMTTDGPSTVTWSPGPNSFFPFVSKHRERCYIARPGEVELVLTHADGSETVVPLEQPNPAGSEKGDD